MNHQDHFIIGERPGWGDPQRFGIPHHAKISAYLGYETNFLKQMMERHGKPQNESVAAIAVGSAINLVSIMFARIYFPTFSNGLKELASFAGARWSLLGASGLQAIVWRHQWKNSGDTQLQRTLREYNQDDCAALKVMTGAFSSRGARDYIRLLGVAQSCKSQGKTFLGFLRSGLKDVDEYKEARSRHRRKRRSQASQGEHFGPRAIE